MGDYNKRSLPDDGSWEAILKDHLDFDKNFEDEAFPANQTSFFREKDDPPAGFVKSTKKWDRIWTLCGGKTSPLVRAGATASDISQGNLGDCYFLSAVANVANSAALIARLFPGNQEINKAGIYAVRFWRDGEYRIVVVDDYLPLRADGRLVMAGSQGNKEFWVPIAEKAWAKLNGSFMAIKGGQQDYAMLALTGILFPSNITLKPFPDERGR
mmetsp:Transcript_26752/g.88938  ORF Transcript_26752/g.88938 Transcript_26752/m.88938 type:complete len:213 (-) Transcript_26752:290-928(-)